MFCGRFLCSVYKDRHPQDYADDKTSSATQQGTEQTRRNYDCD